MGASKRLEEVTLEEWDETINVNLRAAFLLAQQITPGMRNRHWGRVIFVSSIAAFTGGLVGPHYAASKAGLLGLMHSLAASLAPQRVPCQPCADDDLSCAEDEREREIRRE